MQKIYRFNALDCCVAISINEYQPHLEQVLLTIELEGYGLEIPFAREEFCEMCRMPYRFEYPTMTSPESQEGTCSHSE